MIEEKKEQAQSQPEQQKVDEAQKKDVPPVKKEKPSVCGSCGKSIKKKRHYYRNGKFYCTKRCWQSSLKKDAKQDSGA